MSGEKEHWLSPRSAPLLAGLAGGMVAVLANETLRLLAYSSVGLTVDLPPIQAIGLFAMSAIVAIPLYLSIRSSRAETERLELENLAKADELQKRLIRLSTSNRSDTEDGV